MAHFKLSVVKRMATRSTQYSFKAVKEVLDAHDIMYHDAPGCGSFMVEADCYFENDYDALKARKLIEQDLQGIHRNIHYRFDFDGMDKTQGAQ